MAALADVLTARGAEPIVGRCWSSPSFMPAELASLWEAWQQLTTAERSGIASMFPQLHTALFLLLTHKEDRPVGVPDQDYKPVNPYEIVSGVKAHTDQCVYNARVVTNRPDYVQGSDVPCVCDEDKISIYQADTISAHKFHCPARYKRSNDCTCHGVRLAYVPGTKKEEARRDAEDKLRVNIPRFAGKDSVSPQALSELEAAIDRDRPERRTYPVTDNPQE